jgi:hypothetical protein
MQNALTDKIFCIMLLHKRQFTLAISSDKTKYFSKQNTSSDARHSMALAVLFFMNSQVDKPLLSDNL